MHRIPVCSGCLFHHGMLSLFVSESHDTQLEDYTEFAFQFALLQINLIRTAPLLFGGDVHNDKKMYEVL